MVLLDVAEFWGFLLYSCNKKDGVYRFKVKKRSIFQKYGKNMEKKKNKIVVLFSVNPI